MVEIRTKKKLLAAGETCMAITFYFVPGFKWFVISFVHCGLSVEGTLISASVVFHSGAIFKKSREPCCMWK